MRVHNKACFNHSFVYNTVNELIIDDFSPGWNYVNASPQPRMAVNMPAEDELGTFKMFHISEREKKKALAA